MTWKLPTGLTFAILFVAAGACKGDEKDSPPPPPPKPSKPEPPKDAKKDPAGDSTELKKHMQGHFTLVRDIQSALIQGNLDGAKKTATELAEHQPADAVEAWEAHISAMNAAAEAIVEAKDVPTAAKLSAKLGGECAKCHEALTAIATFEWKEKPKVTEGDVKSHMALHKWATDRLWEGLVGPSHSHWLLGAEALANDPLHPGEIKKDEKVPEGVDGFAKKVHELGAKAAKLEEMSDKIDIYGELLGVCSSCHSVMNK